MEELNYALVEDVRPPIYTAMKYWGKKPHNIWREYIANYTSENGLYLDPFAGSAISVFEAVKANKKAIAFDLNPLTSFIIEVISAPFDKNKFKTAVNKILDTVEKDEIYKQHFFTESRNNSNIEEVVCYKWDNGKLYQVGIEENKKPNSKKKPARYLSQPNQNDIAKSNLIANIEIPFLSSLISSFLVPSGIIVNTLRLFKSAVASL